MQSVERALLLGRYLSTGSNDDWAALLAALRPLFARIVYRILAQRGESRPDILDDALQEVLLKIHRQREELRSRLALMELAQCEPYLKAVAANAVRDFCKSRAGPAGRQACPDERSLEEFVASFGVFSSSTAEWSLVCAEINRLLQEDSRDRTVFWLYYRWGFKAREIASISAMSLTEKGVESLLQRTAKRVRLKMAERRPTRHEEGKEFA